MSNGRQKESKRSEAETEVYARGQQLGEEVIGHAHRIKILSLCKLGGMLKATERRDGGQAMKALFRPGTEVPPVLSELGITRKISMFAQKLFGLSKKQVISIADREQSLTQVLRKESGQVAGPGDRVKCSDKEHFGAAKAEYQDKGRKEIVR